MVFIYNHGAVDRHAAPNPGCLYRLPLAVIRLAAGIPPVAVVISALVLGLLAFGAYYSLNSDFFGLATPPLAELSFSSDYSQVSAPDGRRWAIEYEFKRASVFRGVVRHVSHWREADIPFATHDVLVTSGEFSSQARVHTSVMMHTFSFRYAEAPYPAGSINLLHIVPATPETYRQLLELREWNAVEIRGREILRIERFGPDGKFLSYWQDAGCNSILVTSVAILAQGTPVP